MRLVGRACLFLAVLLSFATLCGCLPLFIIRNEKVPIIWLMSLGGPLGALYRVADLEKTYRSYHMFWNNRIYARLVLLVDPPNIVAHQQMLSKANFSFPANIVPLTINSVQRSAINQVFRERGPHHIGYEIQQVMTFYVDIFARQVAAALNVSAPEIIGVVDLDSQMVTLPTLGDIFPKPGKLRIFGLVYPYPYYLTTAQILLKAPAVVDYMITFPFFMHAGSFGRMREHVAKLHGLSFEEALVKAVVASPNGSYYSQFCMLGAYVYHQEKWSYSFHHLKNTEKKQDPLIKLQLHTHKESVGPVLRGCCITYRPYLGNPAECQGWNPVDHVHLIFHHIQNSRVRYPSGILNTHYWLVWRELAQYPRRVRLKEKVEHCLTYIRHPNPHQWFGASTRFGIYGVCVRVHMSVAEKYIYNSAFLIPPQSLPNQTTATKVPLTSG